VIILRVSIGDMVNIILKPGDTNLQKRKRGSDFPIPGKNFPGIFLPLRFYKTVAFYTN